MLRNQERLRNESDYITYQDYELLLNYNDEYTEYDENKNDKLLKCINYGLYEDLEELLGE